MRLLLLPLMVLLLAGCDYEVPLVTTPDVPVERDLLGVWEHTTQQGEHQRLLVLPLGAKEYLVSFPSDSEDTMFARGCMTQVGGSPWVQLRWFGTASAKLPDDGRVYQYLRVVREGDRLELRLLNPEAVPTGVATPGALRQAIERAAGRPDLLREAMRFRRVRAVSGVLPSP